MKRVVVLLFLFAFTLPSFAQSKREWLEYADAAFKNGDYYTASTFYLKVLDKKTSNSTDVTFPYETKPYTPPPKKNKDSIKVTAIVDSTATGDPKEQYVIHQVAECYRLNHDYPNAEIWFRKSAANNAPAYPYERFWYGDALMKNQKYPAANIEFDAVSTAAEHKDSVMFKLAQLKSAGCYLATDTTYIKRDVKVTEMDSLFNAGTSSFAVNYFGDQNSIQFTTARDGNTVTDPKTQKPQFICDIYTLKKTEGGGWGHPQKMEGPVNTENHEGSGFLTLDRSNFYFTKWSTTNKNECSIYLSKLINDKWLAAEKINDQVNLEGYKSMHPCLSPDGSILYFSSNRPGGFGKMDLWYVNLDDDGRPTGAPINMGPTFNTPEDEVTPFFHYYTSTMYFSSNGHAGYGGLDVFKSSLVDSVWTTPKNMGQPVNSSKDDSYFVLERSQQHGFLSSDRKTCDQCVGGSCYKIYSVDKDPNVYDLKGVVYNSENNQIIPNALLTFKDIRGDKEPFYLITDSLGAYFTPLDEGLELYIKAQKNKFFGDAANISTMGLTESKHFVQNFFLSPIPAGDIVIPGIEYDYDKATLRPASKKILDDLYDFLVLNNNLSVEISSHTDARGSDAYNMKLSQERAKSVVDYLIEKGIPKERLVAQGYGETKLLIPDAKTEEEHQKNRRTAFRPIKEGMIQDRWK